MSSDRVAVATGGCQCGAVRFALYVTPEKAHACHCRMCQRAVGGAFALLAGAKKSDFAWTAGEPAFFRSSNLAQRGFCRDCGTPLTFAYDIPEARMYFTIGSFDDPASIPIEMHYGVESKLPWVEFCEDVAAEATGAGSPAAAEFFAKLASNQS